jgi:general secretion pathway protein K
VSVRERGVAAVTAILIVAVAASAATVMLAQQSAMVDQAMLISSRAQADQYARAGIDWARGVLQQDARGVDSLDEGWAQPIAALPVERALVSGIISDEQGKFNLNNLVRSGAPSRKDIQVFEALLASLGLPPELSQSVRDWIDADADLAGPAGAEDPYYLSLAKPYRAANAPMSQVEELYRVRGFDAPTVAKLRPYVTALPAETDINVNTASEALLRAAVPTASNELLQKFMKERTTKPAGSKADFWQRLNLSDRDDAPVNVKSQFFAIRVQVAQDEVELASEALVLRADNTGQTAIVWQRPRY